MCRVTDRRVCVVALALLLATARISVAQPTLARGAAVDELVFERGPRDAAVTIVEFSDFECPYCGRMPAVIEELLQRHPDQVRLVFKHNPLAMHAHAALAHEAALAAGAQGKFWEMHDLLFANQRELQRADLERYAVRLQLDVSAFTHALDAHTYRPLVARDLAEAAVLGVDATPTFIVNGRRLIGSQSLAAMESAVATALSGGPAPLPAPLAVSADSIDRTDAPIRGATNAPLTIVAFSDLQCPFCARVAPTFTELMSRYDGRVKVVFKNFPLDIHPKAPLAHRAALAAGEQGKFWEMHDALFADQRLATPEGVLDLATRLGLDVARFQADMASARVTERVERDKDQGRALGVDGTPTFFVGSMRVVGAHPLSDFVAVIDRELGKLGAMDPAVFRSIGPRDAPLAITWFGDLRSPLNGEATRLVKQLVAAYPAKIRVSFEHAPLAERLESAQAYDAALAAGAQGRFWEMYDLLTTNRDVNEPDDLVRLASRLGLDTARFASDLNQRKFAAVAVTDGEDAARLGISGTPTFVIDGERIDGLLSLPEFRDIVDRYLERSSPVR